MAGESVMTGNSVTIESTDVLVVGAGPAGLTCAVELNRGDAHLKILVVEADTQVGGISKTVNHNGNRIDLGGHRFFSKSDWVMNWWRERFPLMATEGTQQIAYQNKVRNIEVAGTPAADQENVMLLRKRLSRIYYRSKFFDYPLKFNFETFSKLGLVYTIQCGISLLLSRFSRRSPEVSLEDFFINRFGDKLYRTFFKDYTEKVWGESCQSISAEWGAQRIKGVSVRALLMNYLKPLFKLFSGSGGDTKTSLIEQFLYPKLGPGQLWEAVTDDLRQRGVAVDLQSMVRAIAKNSDGTFRVTVSDERNGGSREIVCKYLVSTMPIKNLLDNLQPRPPQAVLDVSHALPYRDFMSVGILVKRLSPQLARRSVVDEKNMPEDNWIYIQEPNVKVGRIQLFNNWSPYLVKDPDTVWLGMEYFCHDTEDFWSWSDAKIIEFAKNELKDINFIEGGTELLEACVIRVPKAYPAYFGAYLQFDVVREYLDSIDGLYVVGRNGMHRYNNQDHSMLTAKFAAESIVEGRDLRAQIWAVNIDDEYHEEAEAEAESA